MTWFYCFLSEPKFVHGPVEMENLETMIGDGRLRSFDLVMKAGEKWMAVDEFLTRFRTERAFASMAMSSPGSCASSPSAIAEWVFMEESGRVHGPYDETSAIALVRRGKISFFDWVWRSGASQWIRVRECQNFIRQEASETVGVRTAVDVGVVEPVPAGALASGDLSSEEEEMTEIFIAKPRELRSVERGNRAAVSAQIEGRAADRQKPEEACGEDLLEDSYWEKGL